MTEVYTRAKLILRVPGFAGLLACAFVLGIAFSFVAPFVSLWGLEEVGMSPTRFSIFMTLNSVMAIVVATTLARWSDTHVPRKVMLLVGATGGALGYSGYAFVRNPLGLSVIGCTLIALSAVCFSQIFAHTRERYFTSQVPGVPPGFLSSVVRVCFSVAWTAGPSVGAWIKVVFGFRGLFLGAATLFLLFLVGVIAFLPHESRPPHARAAARDPLWRVLTRGDLLALFVAFLLIFAAHVINMQNLPMVITRLLGGTAGDVGIAFGIGPLVEVPLMLWFGLLAARGHQLALIRFGVGATVLYFLLLTLTHTPAQVFPLQFFHGLSFAIISNVAIVFFQDLVPGQPGVATAVFTNASSLGNLVGYFSFGQLVDSVGHRGLFLVSAGFTAITLIIVLLYRPRPRPLAA